MSSNYNFISIHSCPICHGAKNRSFFKDNFASAEMQKYLTSYYSGRVDKGFLGEEEFLILYCPSCDFYWHKSVLGKAGLSLLYDTWIDPKVSWEKAIVNFDMKGNLNITETLYAQLKLLKRAKNIPLKLLDFGGGWGQWAAAGLALGCDTYAYEMSLERQSFLKGRGVTCFESFTSMPDDFFDLIILNQVLEHIPSPLDFMRELVKKIKLGGAVFISVPHARPSAPVLAKGAFQPLEHVNGFTPKSLKKLSVALGLTPRLFALNLTGSSAVAWARMKLRNLFARLPVLEHSVFGTSVLLFREYKLSK